MTKKSRQKFKYYENKKSYYDEIKSIFHHFYRAFIGSNKTIFLERESPTLMPLLFFILGGNFIFNLVKS